MSEISSTGDQMLTILEVVARRGPVTTAQVTAICSINRTVAYRLLTTLNNRSYVVKTKDGYVLGPAVASLLYNQPTQLRELARPIMKDLSQKTGETVVLHELDGDSSIVSDQIVGEKHFLRVEIPIGSRFPLHVAAGGLAILAYQPQAKIERLIKRSNGALTPDMVAEVRANGYAKSSNILQSGVHGIGVPIRDQSGAVQAAMVVVVPTGRNCGFNTLLQSLMDAKNALEATINTQLPTD